MLTPCIPFVLELRRSKEKIVADSFGYNDFIFFEAFAKGLDHQLFKDFERGVGEFFFGIGSLGSQH